MPTLAEKIETIVREFFPYSPGTLPSFATQRALAACRRAANLAIEEAMDVAGAHAKDCGCSTAIIADLRALALPEDKTEGG